MGKHRHRHPIAGVLLLAAAATCPAQTSGADLYKAKCQKCHASDGGGKTFAGKIVKAGSFNSPDVLKMPDADLIAVIQKGKNKMPSFAGKLTDEQIADLIAHIHALQK